MVKRYVCAIKAIMRVLSLRRSNDFLPTEASERLSKDDTDGLDGGAPDSDLITRVVLGGEDIRILAGSKHWRVDNGELQLIISDACVLRERRLDSVTGDRQ